MKKKTIAAMSGGALAVVLSMMGKHEAAQAPEGLGPSRLGEPSDRQTARPVEERRSEAEGPTGSKTDRRGDGDGVKVEEDVSSVPAGKEEVLFARVFGSGPFDYRRIKSISARDRGVLLEYLREAGARERGLGRNGPANMYPAVLGDDQAREAIVENFWSEPRLNALSVIIICDPKVIPMLGEGLFMEEEDERRGDVIVPATQMNVAYIMVETLRRSPELGEDVRRWARGQSDRGALMLATLRQWYRENEAVLKAGNFEKVRPGP